MIVYICSVEIKKQSLSTIKNQLRLWKMKYTIGMPS